MTEHTLCKQAATIATLLPKLQRQMFTLDVDDPTIELPVAQLRLCAILRDGPRPMNALSRDLGISVSAITQIADRLERTNLVERVVEGDDRRVKSLQLTARGIEIMQARRACRVERVRLALEQLEPAAREDIIRALQALLDAGLASAPEIADDVLLTEALES